MTSRNLGMDENDLVSIIVPCYNYAHFLSQTLESVIAQSYPYWECIIVNDGSKDNTKEVAQGFKDRDKRFKYIYQKNQGLSASRNTGLKYSTGSLIQFLDADDLLEPKKLEKQVAAINTLQADILYGDMRYFPSEDPSSRIYCMWLDPSEDKPWMPKMSGKGNDILPALIRENIMVVNSPLLKKSLFEEAGLFDENLHSWEDWDFWLRCAVLDKVFIYEETANSLALVRMHKESMSKNSWNMLYYQWKVRKKLDQLLKEKSWRKMNREYISDNLKSLSRLAGEELEKGNKDTALTSLRLLYSETGYFRFFLLILYARILPPNLFQKMISVHFQTLKTTFKNQFRKLFYHFV